MVELSIQQYESIKKFIEFYCNFDNYESSGFYMYKNYLNAIAKQRIKSVIRK